MAIDYYVALKIEADDLREADKIAEGISDTVQYPISWVWGTNIKMDGMSWGRALDEMTKRTGEQG